MSCGPQIELSKVKILLVLVIIIIKGFDLAGIVGLLAFLVNTCLLYRHTVSSSSGNSSSGNSSSGNSSSSSSSNDYNSVITSSDTWSWISLPFSRDLTCHGRGYGVGMYVGCEHGLLEVGHKGVFHVHFIHINTWKLL